MADTKITGLTNLATPEGADLLAVVDDVAGTPTTKKATITNVEAILTHDNLIAGTIASHDTTATGANLTTLTDGSNSDSLHIHEGTAIKSTGESGGTKFLRENGDNSSSWNVPDHTELLNIGTNTHAQIDTHIADTTDAHSVSSDTLTFTNKTFDADGTGNTISNIENADIKAGAGIEMSKTAFVAGTNCTLSTNTLNVDDAFLKNDAEDTGVGIILTQDNSTVDTQFTPQVLYNTDATPPTASGFPIGTIYIQYTP